MSYLPKHTFICLNICHTASGLDLCEAPGLHCSAQRRYQCHYYAQKTLQDLAPPSCSDGGYSSGLCSKPRQPPGPPADPFLGIRMWLSLRGLYSSYHTQQSRLLMLKIYWGGLGRGASVGMLGRFSSEHLQAGALIINIVIGDPERSELPLYNWRALQTHRWKEYGHTHTNIIHKIGNPSEDVHKGKIIRNPLIGKTSHRGGRGMGPELRRQFGKSLRTFFTRASLKQIKQRFFLPAGSGRGRSSHSPVPRSTGQPYPPTTAPVHRPAPRNANPQASRKHDLPQGLSDRDDGS